MPHGRRPAGRPPEPQKRPPARLAGSLAWLDGTPSHACRCNHSAPKKMWGNLRLKEYGSSATELLTSCTERGYAIHARAGKGLSTPLSIDQALADTEGYTDFLILPTERSVGTDTFWLSAQAR